MNNSVMEGKETQIQNTNDTKVTATKRGGNDWRADLISQARLSQNVLKSLQPLHSSRKCKRSP